MPFFSSERLLGTAPSSLRMHGVSKDCKRRVEIPCNAPNWVLKVAPPQTLNNRHNVRIAFTHDWNRCNEPARTSP